MNLADQLHDAGLTGRGGAAFSTARKLRLASQHNARLIVNACDGEVGAHKDAFVIAQHLTEVRHGAGLLTRSEILYAAHRDSATLRRLRDAGLPTLEVPRRYVSSEESALVNLSEGGLARPVTKRKPIASGGVAPDARQLPATLVLNAETVWRVSQIATNGPAWFRSIGTAEEPGPRLVTIGGAVRRPGVIEVAAGMSVASILDQADANPRATAIHLGGLSGGFATAPRSLTWSRTSLAAHGLFIGSGVIAVLDPTRCPWEYVLDLVDYGAGESAGQCGPCMFGLPAVAQDLHTVASAAGSGVEDRLRMRLGLLPGRGACAYPTGVARFVDSALTTFGAELVAHRQGRCIESGDRRQAQEVRREPLHV